METHLVLKIKSFLWIYKVIRGVSSESSWTLSILSEKLMLNIIESTALELVDLRFEANHELFIKNFYSFVQYILLKAPLR